MLLLLGVFDLLLDQPYFTPLRSGVSGFDAGQHRDTRWWLTFAGGALLPALTLLPFFELGNRFFPPSRWFPQSFTNEIATWAVLNGLILYALSFLPGRLCRHPSILPRSPSTSAGSGNALSVCMYLPSTSPLANRGSVPVSSGSTHARLAKEHDMPLIHLNTDRK